jgi:glycosyltransferase involved in cell wall biosynthesis
MTSKPKISGLVLTHNSERTIKECVEPVKELIDELIVVDDYSTDETLKIVKKIYPKAKIFKKCLNYDFASQRNFALEKSEHQWVLFIDSDEYLTDGLKKEILEVLKSPKYDCYVSRRDNKMVNHYFKGTSGRPILLKRHLRFKGRLHEQVAGAEFGYLKEPLIHQHWKDATDWIETVNKYSYMAANKWLQEKRNYGRVSIFLIGVIFPIYWFVKIYFVQGKWKAGMMGLLYSLGYCSQWTFTALKYYEMKYGKNKK